MKKSSELFFLVFLFLIPGFFTQCNKASVEIYSNLIDNMEDPAGVDLSGFHFSWKTHSDMRGATQSAYRIVLADYEDDIYVHPVWDSEKQASGQNLLLTYSGPDLEAGRKYRWKVKIWDNAGNESAWSHDGVFITGLPAHNDWEGARWISFAEMDPSDRILPGVHWPPWPPSMAWVGDLQSGDHALPLFRNEFQAGNDIDEAIVYVSGLGHYELLINGHKVGDHFLAPAWSKYNDYAYYNMFEVTELLQQGGNTLGIMPGNGFLNVPTSRYRKLNIAYDYPKAILKLKIRYSDGTTEAIVSNGDWTWDTSPITYSNIYGGENYNAMLEQEGWDTPDFDDSGWLPVVELPSGDTRLVAERDYPVKVMERLPVQEVHKIDGREAYIYDFGQNAAGIIELKVRGSRGDTIKFIPAELLKRNGTADQGATGSPYYYIYVLKGAEEETWSPRFTYYGFRYVQVVGAVPEGKELGSDLPVILDMELLHNRNSAPDAGYFNTSFELFNRINNLILWAIKSNYQSVITDCPTREKLGWLEQSFLMGGGIHFNYDVYHVFHVMIEGMKHDQTGNGMVPSITPEYVEFWEEFRDLPEWGSAAVVLPWLLYKWYGDASQIEGSWDMMTRYAAYLVSRSDHNIVDFGLGDWYDLGPEPPGYSQHTPIAVTATAIYYYDLVLLSKMADLLGKAEEKSYYTGKASEVKEAFNNTFLNRETKVYATGSQTAMAMPLVMGLVEDAEREVVVKNLVDSIVAHNYALTAGDIGFHFLVRALMDAGRPDILFKMNNRDDMPGYGYQLRKGATTLTESWDALGSKSNNHLMLGHIMEWFYSGLAGIGQTDASVAYREVHIDPAYIEEIGRVDAAFEAPYGEIASSVIYRDGQWELHLSIPFNTTAIVNLPGSSIDHIQEGGRGIDEREDIEILTGDGDRIRVRIGSGEYAFTVTAAEL